MLKNEADSCRIIGELKTSHYVESSKSGDKSEKCKLRKARKWRGKGKGKGKCPVVAEKDTTCIKCGAKGHKLTNHKCPQYGKDAKRHNAKIALDQNIEEA